MEGGAVGQVRQMNRVPFVVIRIISDSAGSGAAREFIMSLGDASELSYRLVFRMMEKLTQVEKDASAASSANKKQSQPVG